MVCAMERSRQQPNRLGQILLRARCKAYTKAILIRRSREKSPSRRYTRARLLGSYQNRFHIDRTAPSAPDIKPPFGDRKLHFLAHEVLPQRLHGNLLQCRVRRPQTEEVLLEGPVLQ